MKLISKYIRIIIAIFLAFSFSYNANAELRGYPNASNHRNNHSFHGIKKSHKSYPHKSTNSFHQHHRKYSNPNPVYHYKNNRIQHRYNQHKPCHQVSKLYYDDYGKPHEIAGTQCYNRRGQSYIVSGSRFQLY